MVSKGNVALCVCTWLHELHVLNRRSILGPRSFSIDRSYYTAVCKIFLWGSSSWVVDFRTLRPRTKLDECSFLQKWSHCTDSQSTTGFSWVPERHYCNAKLATTDVFETRILWCSHSNALPTWNWTEWGMCNWLSWRQHQ